MLTRWRSLYRTRTTANDRGFSLAEVLVATTMIGALVAVLASLLAQAAKAQTRMMAQQVANNVIQAEVSAVQASDWQDIMLRPTAANGGSVCELTNRLLDTSAMSVRPADRLIVDDFVFDVTRDVRWFSGNSQVTCSNAPNDRNDIKVVTISVRWWPDGEEQKNRTTRLYLSSNYSPQDGASR